MPNIISISPPTNLGKLGCLPTNFSLRNFKHSSLKIFSTSCQGCLGNLAMILFTPNPLTIPSSPLHNGNFKLYTPFLHTTFWSPTPDRVMRPGISSVFHVLHDPLMLKCQQQISWPQDPHNHYHKNIEWVPINFNSLQHKYSLVTIVGFSLIPT